MGKHVAFVQGVYFLATGVWPLVSINTFQAVTGPKTDTWLVKTVGAIIAVIGAALLIAGAEGDFTPAIMVLALGSAAGLAAIDVAYAARRVISSVYLFDAIIEVGLVVWWGVSM